MSLFDKEDVKYRFIATPKDKKVDAILVIAMPDSFSNDQVEIEKNFWEDQVRLFPESIRLMLINDKQFGLIGDWNQSLNDINENNVRNGEIILNNLADYYGYKLEKMEDSEH